MHALQLACDGGGGGGGSSSGGSNGSADWTQYCNLVVVVECAWYSGCTCMACMVVVSGGGGMWWLYVHGMVAVCHCGGAHVVAVTMVVVVSSDMV